ncbi:hypothetical protein [Novosphingobium olei]|uniref:Glycerophosphoryl diester phosphodiesterase membrane domain-containing protein n=1 Tax=Novosphingobium olei TaxID=2728851 RepID=A0A7Y0G9W3_9SPHN|nr:hypothetical protein [Novosphingobium olei]NML94626.1 hypothetical protein [Novosphingobium olei]
MTTLDSSTAWSSATRMVAANRDVLAPIAGVFFFLPGLIGAIFVPAPAVQSGMNEAQMIDAMQSYYAGSLPLLILLSLIPMAGMLTMLVAMIDASRPTIGEAIRRSFRALPAYFAGQLLVALALTPAVLLIVGLLGAVLPAALAVAIAMAVLLWPVMRTMLIGPILASGRERSPIAAIRESMRLTRGNSGRMLAFIGLAGFLFLVVYGLVMMVVGVVLVLVSGGEPQRVLAEAISGVLIAAAYTYFVAILAAIHEQLAGRDTTPASTFG